MTRIAALALVLLGLPGLQALAQDDPQAEPSLVVLVNDLGNSYFEALAGSARDTARSLWGADTDVRLYSSGYDVARQQAQLQSVAGAGPQLVLLTAAHPTALEAQVTALRQQGTVVIAVDVATAGADLVITTDNYQAGRLSCQHLAEQLSGRGRIAILDGPPVSSIGERLEGCDEALTHYPDIAVVDRENSGASYLGGLESMTRLLTRNTDLQGVFSINDPASEGAVAAIEGQDRYLVVASVDGSPSAVSRLQSGNSQLINTAAQFPRRIAEEAVRQGAELLRDRVLNNEAVGPPEGHEILIPVDLIHAGNALNYCDWQRCD